MKESFYIIIQSNSVPYYLLYPLHSKIVFLFTLTSDLFFFLRFHSFLLLSNIPLSIYTTSLSTHLVCLFLIGVELLYNVVLVSSVQQSESTICIPISPPSWTSLPPTTIPRISVTTEHQAELPVLYSRLPLAIYFTHGSVYMSILISQFIPFPPSPPCPQVHFLHLRVYSYPANWFI